jgi:hypothetical protein
VDAGFPSAAHVAPPGRAASSRRQS